MAISSRNQAVLLWNVEYPGLLPKARRNRVARVYVFCSRSVLKTPIMCSMMDLLLEKIRETLIRWGLVLDLSLFLSTIWGVVIRCVGG